MAPFRSFNPDAAKVRSPPNLAFVCSAEYGQMRAIFASTRSKSRYNRNTTLDPNRKSAIQNTGRDNLNRMPHDEKTKAPPCPYRYPSRRADCQCCRRAPRIRSSHHRIAVNAARVAGPDIEMVAIPTRMVRASGLNSHIDKLDD